MTESSTRRRKKKTDDMNDFLRKNLNKYHIIGVILGVGLSVVYWFKSGRFSDNFLKSNLILMIIWGVLVGYITFDLVFNAKNRKDNE